jgi:hypothetical protein
MGTNFYWLEKEPCDHCGRGASEGDHIGKRSAAGLFCWDCGETLCEGGNAAVHFSRHAWAKTCRKCGAAPAQEDHFKTGPVAVELGFSAPREERPKGVRGTSSFSWAQEPEGVRRRCEAEMDRKLVVDEYGRITTGREFLAMLRSNCGIESTSSVGQSFS